MRRILFCDQQDCPHLERQFAIMEWAESFTRMVTHHAAPAGR